MAAATGKEMKLLFFDTLHHGNSKEELNLDLIQFSKPVVVHELRVVPLKTYVELNIGKGLRLGGTLPAEFKLDVFVNNLEKPKSSTFEKLGQLDYKENINILLKPDREVATDGLILKGWYRTVTLAVYGWETVVKPPQDSPPPPPPPLPGHQPPQSKAKIPGLDISDEETTKPVVQQQHKLDFLNEQVQKRQQLTAASSGRDLHKPSSIEDSFDVLRKLSPRRDISRDTDRSTIRDQDRGLSRDLDRGSSRDKDRDYTFPPEPNEPYELREKTERDRSRSRERDRDSRHTSRDDERPHSREDREREHRRERIGRHGSRELEGRDSKDHSRERSREPRDSKDNRDSSERERVREERHRDRSERDSGRDLEDKEREIKLIETRERESEQKEKEMKEKEREKDLLREKEQREKDMKEREQKEKEKEKEAEKDRERQAKERELECEREKERFAEREVRSKEHDRPVSKQPSSLRSRSRSGSRTRKRSISPSKPRSSRNRKRSRSRSKEPIKPPEPPLSGDEDNDEDEEAPEDEEMEDQDLFNAGSERSGLRRYKGPASDGEDREVEKDYEDISSEDEMAAIEDPTMMQVLDLYELEEEPWGGFHTLNPVEFYVTPLMELKSPALSKFEIQMLRYASHDDGAIERPQEAIELLNIIYTFTQEEHTDKWVVAIEELPDLLEKGLSYLMIHENKNDFLDTLVSWAIKGCDSDIAMSQLDAAFKVRHLKAGIRLAGCLSVLNEQIALTLLQRGIQLKLVSLIESEYIVFSIKHLALRSLSKTTHFAVGTQWFLGVHPDYTKGDNEETGYQRLVRNLLLEKIVKLTMSMTALLRKIHFYETLTNLYNTVERIVSSCPIPDESSNEEDEQPQLKDEDTNKILADLEEATQIFTDPHFYIGQQHNAVPYTLLVDTNTKSSESLETIYNIADSCGLLESLFALLSCPASAANPSVYLSVHTILQRFMSTQDGLLYLCSHPDVINGIIRCLLQMVEEPEESGDDIPSRQLGLELVYHLQVVQYIDQLYHCQNKVNKLVDDPEVIVILHGLYTMTYSAANRDPLLGRNILSKVFSFDKNIEVLLPYLERTGDEDFDMLMKRSVCANCSIQLLLIVIKTSSDVNLLSNYAHRLLALCENGGSTKLSQLQEWLAPAKKVTSFDLDGLPSIISQLKQYTDDVKKVPPGLITIVRMIYFLISSAAADASVDNLDTLNEAKYRYVIVELYSSECFPIFINILQKLSESQLKVWQQGIPYTTDQWLTYFSLIKPTLSLVHATLCQLIQAFRVEAKEALKIDTEMNGAGDKDPLIINSFKDLTSIPVLLELHTVMCSVPTSSLYNNDLAKIQKDIVDTLLAFTQEELQETQTDDALSKSLWTLMLKELLKYTIKSPYTYMSGLLILSELLPLPFPLHTKDPLTDGEMDAAVMSRKLWSVHLQSATPELFAVLDTLSGTGCQPLQHLMRRVCWQIADLAAPSSLRITKILLDILMVSLKPKKPTQPTEGEEEPTAVRSVSIHTAKTLNLLAYLLSHPGIKAALLQLIGTSINNDTKYSEFLAIMLQLLNQTAETAAEIQTQEGIVSMIQNLCDLEVSMVNTDLPVTLAEHLANSLPENILMAEIMAALLEHIGNPSQSYASILPCLRTLTMLTDHDYGFYHLKMNLERNITVLHTLLNRINNTFSKDSSDCLSTLSSTLELLRVMTTIDQAEDMAVTRTKVISREELRQFLLWNPSVRHPLEELEELSREEETLESILESITALTSILRCPPEVPQEGDTNVEPFQLPTPASLTDLFNQRAVYTILDSEDERLSPSYWLANPASDEPDAEPEVLRCDLQAICEHHLPDFNLEEELKKEASTAEEDMVRPKRPKDRRKSHEIISINRGGKTGKKPFVAPMRGRGIMNHSLMLGSRSNDLFRTRAPNTSRPPSMHVDDFVKMENSQQQQEQQQQHQQPPLRPPMTPPLLPGNRDNREKVDELPRGRGFERGRGFGLPPRGRFYTPPAPYSRREAMLHEAHPPPPPPQHPSPHRGNMNSGRGGGILPLERPRTNFMAPRQFPRGSERQGPPPDRHGNRNGRFSPGRGGRGNQWGRGRDVGETGRFAGGGFRGRRDGGRHVRSFTK
ncbi:protein virilizer [Biomphalaria glabrata]|uniref:Protein virilizer homolog n=1 Tax=Biomphalaria glabrata TaxID=6526 RepID=A0A9W3AZA5_BIOGL|nr:protein virilizer homolog [Biomphalaria glabrata]KAI8762230.1 putative protein virilizer [Biomphalaria glabrata]